jgi:hypothetical protein
VPPECRRCSFCCDVYNPVTQRHCPWSHITLDRAGTADWDDGAEKARVLSGLAQGAPQALVGVVEAIGAREAARQAGRDTAADPAFDSLMALKCDLIDVEAAVPWEVCACVPCVCGGVDCGAGDGWGRVETDGAGAVEFAAHGVRVLPRTLVVYARSLSFPLADPE